MGSYWRGRKVLVTGGSGFIGSHLVEALVAKGAEVRATAYPPGNLMSLENLTRVRERITVLETDLSRLENCRTACSDQNVVFNTAYIDGSTAFKRSRPAFIFRQNMMLTLNMLEAAYENKVGRFLVMSSAEVYSPETSVPIAEAEGFLGLPSPHTDGYAWSKRMAEFAAEVFAREYGLKVAIARPTNVYGPRDYFDDEKGRVIPTFIKKVFHGEEPIVIWGTGEQVRTFIYVEDLVRGLLDLVEKDPDGDPINFSGEEEITIREVAEKIIRLSGRRANVVCDPGKPAGPLKRNLDTNKAKQRLNFTTTVALEEGLKRTIDAYREKSSVSR